MALPLRLDLVCNDSLIRALFRPIHTFILFWYFLSTLFHCEHWKQRLFLSPTVPEQAFFFSLLVGKGCVVVFWFIESGKLFTFPKLKFSFLKKNFKITIIITNSTSAMLTKWLTCVLDKLARWKDGKKERHNATFVSPRTLAYLFSLIHFSLVELVVSMYGRFGHLDYGTCAYCMYVRM
jgi:hypothetical protein